MRRLLVLTSVLTACHAAPKSVTGAELAEQFCQAVDRHCKKKPIGHPVCVSRLSLTLHVQAEDEQKELDAAPLPWPGDIEGPVNAAAALCDDYNADPNTVFALVRQAWLVQHPLPPGHACTESTDPDYRPCASPENGSVACVPKPGPFNQGATCVQRIPVAKGQECGGTVVLLYCADPTLSCNVVCKEAASGDPCDVRAPLDMCVGMYCDGSTCIPLAGPGQTCVSTVTSADAAAGGEYSDNCRDMGTFCDGTCVARKRVGEACQQYDVGSQCESGLVCTNGKCASP